MKWLLFIATMASVSASESRPGLIGKATDGELTVFFVAPSPNVVLQGADSIHPQLKPTFRGEFSGILSLTNAKEISFPESPSVLIDGEERSGKTVTLPAGRRKIRISFSRETTNSFRIDFPFPVEAFSHDRAPRELKENQSRDFGRQLFEDLNCASCHGDGPMAFRFTEAGQKAKSLTSLHPTFGCLSDTPEAPGKKFDLSAAERESLQFFVQSPDISPAPLIDFARQMSQFHCSECHSNLRNFRASNFEGALLNHAGVNISTNDAGELARNYARVAQPYLLEDARE